MFLGGLTGVHQFGRVGAHAMTASFTPAWRKTCRPSPLAAIRPKRRASTPKGWKRVAERITLIKQMYRLLYRKGLNAEAARQQINALRGEAEADADYRAGWFVVGRARHCARRHGMERAAGLAAGEAWAIAGLACCRWLRARWLEH